MSNGEKFLNWNHPLMNLVVISTAWFLSTWHIAYFHCQDGNLSDEVIDQCVRDAQVSQVTNEPIFYDAHESELAMPEDSLP
jgi:hypothetical protein